VHFNTDCCFSFVLISDQRVNIHINKIMLSRELFSDLLTKIVAIGAWSDVDDAGLHFLVNVFHHFFPWSLGIDAEEIGVAS